MGRKRGPPADRRVAGERKGFFDLLDQGVTIGSACGRVDVSRHTGVACGASAACRAGPRARRPRFEREAGGEDRGRVGGGGRAVGAGIWICWSRSTSPTDLHPKVFRYGRSAASWAGRHRRWVARCDATGMSTICRAVPGRARAVPRGGTQDPAQATPDHEQSRTACLVQATRDGGLSSGQISNRLRGDTGRAATRRPRRRHRPRRARRGDQNTDALPGQDTLPGPGRRDGLVPGTEHGNGGIHQWDKPAERLAKPLSDHNHTWCDDRQNPPCRRSRYAVVRPFVLTVNTRGGFQQPAPGSAVKRRRLVDNLMHCL